MKKKLNRRELVQAGLATGAAFTLAVSTTAPADAAEADAAAAPESPTDPTYSHVRACCTSTWKNPACPGNPASFTTDKAGTLCSCSHSY